MPEPTYYITGHQGSVDSLPLYYLSRSDLFFDEGPSMVNNPDFRCNAPFKCRQHCHQLINNIKLAIAKKFK